MICYHIMVKTFFYCYRHEISKFLHYYTVGTQNIFSAKRRLKKKLGDGNSQICGQIFFVTEMGHAL